MYAGTVSKQSGRKYSKRIKLRKGNQRKKWERKNRGRNGAYIFIRV